MTKCKRQKGRVSGKRQKVKNLAMTKKQSSARSSARTGKSVNSMSTPFRRGSVRGKLYTYLSVWRSYKMFVRQAKRFGVDPIRTLRVFREGGYKTSSDGIQISETIIKWHLEEKGSMMRVITIKSVGKVLE